MSTHSNGVIVGNVYDKYGTRNPVARRLMAGFLDAVSRLYNEALPERVLEVGCGEGRLARALVDAATHKPKRFVATDVSLHLVEAPAGGVIDFREASVYELPFAEGEFDLVVCCEVLEHLEDPRRALREIARVSGKRILVSTPREPLWRILNLARGKYLRELGNTPGHVQHFSKHALERVVGEHFRIERVLSPVPWTVILAATR